MSTERKEFESWVARVRLPYCDTPADRAQQWIGWQGCRASPAAALPEGALPPLPKPKAPSNKYFSDEPVYSADEVERIRIAAYAIGRGDAVRDYVNGGAAAVEADRAQRPTDLREQFDAAFLSWNGFHTKAELDAEWAKGTLAGEMFRAGAASRADRAQQGEPVGYLYGDEFYQVGNLALNDHIRANGEKLYRAATKAAAPADAPTDLPKRLRIKAGVMASGEKIAWGSDTELMLEAADYIERAAPVPDTGIPTAGEVELRAALKPFADAYAPEAERVARFYTPDDLAKYGDAFDRNTVTPTVTMGDFRRAYEAFRAPVSSTQSNKDQE